MTAAIGMPTNRRNPKPIDAPSRSEPSRATASAARGTNRTSRRPSRKDETVVASQTRMRLTVVRPPTSKSKPSRRSDPAADTWRSTRSTAVNRGDDVASRRCARRSSVTRPFNENTSSATLPDTVTSPLNAITLPRHVAVDRRVAVEDDGVAHGGSPTGRTSAPVKTTNGSSRIAPELGERGGGGHEHRRRSPPPPRAPIAGRSSHRPPSSCSFRLAKATASRAGRSQAVRSAISESNAARYRSTSSSVAGTAHVGPAPRWPPTRRGSPGRPARAT